MRRFLFVNATHPDQGHVSALRVASLGRAIARQGHEVFLLTRPLDAGTQTPVGLDSVEAPQAGCRVIEESRNGGRLLHLVAQGGRETNAHLGLPLLRRATTAVNWLRGQSSDPEWVRSASKTLMSVLAEVHIDLVWGTFTPIESLTIAGQFAKARDIPFVADIKDDWQHYVPPGLRRVVAARLRSAAAFTSNSIEQWPSFPVNYGPREVIYSGYWRNLTVPAQAKKWESGSIFTGVFFGRADPVAYRPLLEYMCSWADSRGHSLQLKYFGASWKVMQHLASEVTADSGVKFVCSPYVSTDQLMEECAMSDFNFYIRAPHGAIHHKATELMAATQPILVWGVETMETLGLAERVGVPMLACTELGEVHDALDQWLQRIDEQPDLSSESDQDWLTWEHQSERLMQYFEQTISGRWS